MRRATLLPLFFVTYALAYLDRANYGFGAAAGMAHSLGITESRSALLAALFFLGYSAFQLPGMLLARRLSATRVVFGALLCWGVCASLMGVIRSFAWLAVDRLLLGVAESVVFPAMLLLLTRWFGRAERSRANTVLMLGNPVTVLCMSAATGFLIERVGWQHTFVVEGLPAVLWAFVWMALVRDHPREARWMNREAALALEAGIAAEQPSTGNAPTRLLPALLRGDVLLLSLQYFCWSLGVYGFVLWLPAIVHSGAAVSLGSTGLRAAVPYALAVPCMLLVARAADRSRQRAGWVWPCLLIAGVAMLGSFLTARYSFRLAYGCLAVAGAAMYAPYGPFFAIIPERVEPQVAGEVFALVNSSGALGGFVGSYLVGLLHALTGTETAGYLLMALSLIAAALLLLCLQTTERSPQHA